MIYNHFCHTSCGDIQGIAAKAPGITAFKGIQYAKAGRWEYPRQITHWDGIYDASQFGPNAMQESAFIPEYKTGRPTFYYREFREGLNYKYSEDCLYLNIWTPDDANGASVIVYIHGGAFTGGSGWDKAFDEPVWPQKGAIAVTVNYRLGLFGYACLPELTAEVGHSGNYGLYDQLCAIHWVHDNIAAFGGNPDNITVMGQSAGAHSVQMLCSTPAAEKLIHRAVMSSGAGDTSVLFDGDWRMESKYSFWDSWKQFTGFVTLAELRAQSPQILLDALSKQVAVHGFSEIMTNIGPVWDNVTFQASKFTLQIPYLAGGNTQDINPGLAADAMRWCRRQPVKSYAWYFARQLPGDDKGAWHSADLWYWFGTLDNAWRPFTEGDYILSNQMAEYLVNFANTGNPNGAGLTAWEDAKRSGKLLRLDWPGPTMADL